MSDERLSYCRICAAACGIVVSLDGERAVKVRGDAEHPVSRGYICAKARGLPAWHHAGSRLDHPTVRGKTVAWDEAIADLGAALGDVVSGRGPDAVGLYLATGLAYDAGGQVAAGMWLASIGSRSFYTAATVDNAPVLVAAELVTGSAMLNPVWDPTTPGLLLLVGTNPVVSHGYGTTLPDPVRYLRDFRQGGGRVWVIDPRRTETAALADGHLQGRPGADAAVLAALASALLADGADALELAEFCAPEDVEALRSALAPFSVARAARVADVDPATIEQLLADVRACPGRLAVFCGTGTTMATDGVVVEWLRWVLLILSGSLDRPGGMRFWHPPLGRLRPPGGDRRPQGGPVSRPELPRVARQLPAVALADEIEGGQLRALVVTGGNPLTAIPEPDRMRAALHMLDTLVVIDVMDSEICGLATHVLPATGQLERADLTPAAHMSVGFRLQSTPPVLPPVADRRPVWWMLGRLAEQMGGDLLGGVAPDVMTDEAFLIGLLGQTPFDGREVFEAGPRGVAMPVDVGWVRATMLTDRRWRIAPPELLSRLAGWVDPVPRLVLTPRREMAWSNSVCYAGSGVEAVVRIHPGEAETAGLQDGDAAIVSSAHGSMRAAVAIDARVRSGVASVTHGRGDHNPGALTSSRHEVDPMTTMPHASGLRVTIAPVE